MVGLQPQGPAVGGRRKAKTRAELIREIERAEEVHNETLRRLIVEKGRVDVLAQEVLGWDFEPCHMRIAQWQAMHRHSGVLAPRSIGKTWVAVGAQMLIDILQDRNVRIILGSNSTPNGMETLGMVKKIMSDNEKFRLLFGDLVGDLWRDDKIIVAGRKGGIREPTIVVVSPESAVSGKHGTRLYGDDLVDQRVAGSNTTREQLSTFFWKTLKPTLEMDVGRMRFCGTRYHWEDLYGEFMREGGYLEGKFLVLQAIQTDENGEEKSIWEKKLPLADLQAYRASKRIAFDTQMMQDVTSMRGGGFVDYDWCKRFSPSEVPGWEDLPVYMGVDPSSGETAASDYFFVLLARYDAKAGHIYIYRAVRQHYTFAEQRTTTTRLCDDQNVIRGGVDAVAYQSMLLQELKAARPDLPLFPIKTKESKSVRLQQRTQLLEDGRVFFGPGLDQAIDEIVRFDGSRSTADRKDDAVDAFLNLCDAIFKRVRKEPLGFGLPMPGGGSRR